MLEKGYIQIGQRGFNGMSAVHQGENIYIYLFIFLQKRQSFSFYGAEYQDVFQMLTIILDD